jgi:hypothetical protein
VRTERERIASEWCTVSLLMVKLLYITNGPGSADGLPRLPVKKKTKTTM